MKDIGIALHLQGSGFSFLRFIDPRHDGGSTTWTTCASDCAASPTWPDNKTIMCTATCVPTT